MAWRVPCPHGNPLRSEQHPGCACDDPCDKCGKLVARLGYDIAAAEANGFCCCGTEVRVSSAHDLTRAAFRAVPRIEGEVMKLRVGERVRLTPDGPVLTVVRVTPCAAYVRGGELREVSLPDGRTFTATANRTEPISARAFVYREE